jgi:hypothetical protein
MYCAIDSRLVVPFDERHQIEAAAPGVLLEDIVTNETGTIAQDTVRFLDPRKKFGPGGFGHAEFVDTIDGRFHGENLNMGACCHYRI